MDLRVAASSSPLVGWHKTMGLKALISPLHHQNQGNWLDFFYHISINQFETGVCEIARWVVRSDGKRRTSFLAPNHKQTGRDSLPLIVPIRLR